MIIILPMAGRGSRFRNAGIDIPKPFISVDGKPMFVHALKSIEGLHYSKIIFIVLKEHYDAFDMNKCLKEAGINNYKLVVIPEVTEGQLATVLAAAEYFNLDEDVLILSSDTYVKSPLVRDIVYKKPHCEGIISVAKLPGSQWSFAEVDDNNEVSRVAEKERISDYASTGLYYFSNGKHLLKYASEMISKKEKTRNEYYVIPVYQKFIDDGKMVSISIAEEMWDMGTPDALEEYLKNH